MSNPGPPLPEAHAESHSAFFRQGGWLILATTVSGGFMLATQIVAAKWMATDEYKVFFALLRVYLLLGIPSIGLQTIFAHQAAAAVTADQQRLLTGAIRAVLRGTFLFWAVVAGLTFLSVGWLVARLGISNPLAIWATLAMGLGCLWGPVLRGVVQGRQHFTGLGVALILDGVGRFLVVTLILLAGGQAAGGLSGALVGLSASIAVCAWLARDVMRGRPARFVWGPWLRHVVPLTLGAGAVLLFTTADVVYVRGVFPDAAQDLYIPASMIGLALMMYALPLAQVMFPKVARSIALTGRSSTMPLALGVTAGGVALGAIVCTLLPGVPLRLVFFSKPEFWPAAALVPWFAWAVVPLTLANVLINNLLAQERFGVVPWIVGIGILYLGLLTLLRGWFPAQAPLTACRVLLALMGGCNVLLLVAGVVYTARPADAGTVPAP